MLAVVDMCIGGVLYTVCVLYDRVKHYTLNTVTEISSSLSRVLPLSLVCQSVDPSLRSLTFWFGCLFLRLLLRARGTR